MDVTRRPVLGWQVRAVVLVAILLASACSGGDEASEELPPSSESTTGTSSSTTSSTTTTLPTTSETTATTADPDDPESAIREVHTRVFTEMFARDEFVDGPEARLELALELTVDPLLARIQDTAQRREESGERAISQGYVSNIVEVEIEGDLARVVDCSQDRGALYTAARELLVPADDFFKLRTSQLRFIDSRWYVEEIFTGGDERCDPDDLS